VTKSGFASTQWARPLLLTQEPALDTELGQYLAPAVLRAVDGPHRSFVSDFA